MNIEQTKISENEENDFINPQITITSLKNRLIRRNILLEEIRKAYYRDVIVLKQEVLNQSKQAPSENTNTSISYTPSSTLSSLPSVDLRECLQLFAPNETFLRLNPCELCGGTIDIVHAECEKIMYLKASLDTSLESERLSKETISKLTEEIRIYKKRNETLEQQLNFGKKENSLLLEQKTQSAQQSQEYKKKYNDLRITTEKAQKEKEQMQKLVTEISLLKQENKHYIERNKHLNNQNQQFEKEIDSMRLRLETLTRIKLSQDLSLEEDKNKISKCEEEIISLKVETESAQKEIENLINEIQRLKIALEESREEEIKSRKILEQTKRNYNDTIESAEKSQDILREQLQNYRQNEQKLRKSFESAEAKNREDKETLEKQQSELESLETQIKLLEQKNPILLQQLEVAKDIISKKDIDLKALEEKCDSDTKIIILKAKKIKELTETIKDLETKQVNNLNNENPNNENSAKENENEDFKRKKIEKKASSTNEQLKAEIEKLEEALTLQQEKLSRKETMEQNLQEQIQLLQMHQQHLIDNVSQVNAINKETKNTDAILKLQGTNKIISVEKQLLHHSNAQFELHQIFRALFKQFSLLTKQKNLIPVLLLDEEQLGIQLLQEKEEEKFRNFESKSIEEKVKTKLKYIITGFHEKIGQIIKELQSIYSHMKNLEKELELVKSEQNELKKLYQIETKKNLDLGNVQLQLEEKILSSNASMMTSRNAIQKLQSQISQQQQKEHNLEEKIIELTIHNTILSEKLIDSQLALEQKELEKKKLNEFLLENQRQLNECTAAKKRCIDEFQNLVQANLDRLGSNIDIGISMKPLITEIGIQTDRWKPPGLILRQRNSSFCSFSSYEGKAVVSVAESNSHPPFYSIRPQTVPTIKSYVDDTTEKYKNTNLIKNSLKGRKKLDKLLNKETEQNQINNYLRK